MGIDISGGMIVGAWMEECDIPETAHGDEYDWVEEHGMETMSLHYDCGDDGKFIGYEVRNVAVDELVKNRDWIDHVDLLGKRFQRLLGVKATLVGMQDVY